MIRPAPRVDPMSTCVFRECRGCLRTFLAQDLVEKRCHDCRYGRLSNEAARAEVYAEADFLDSPDLPCPPRLAKGDNPGALYLAAVVLVVVTCAVILWALGGGW